MKPALTRHALQQFGVTHLTLPYICEDVLHSFSSPQEVEHSQVVAHALTGEHLTQVWYVVTDALTNFLANFEKLVIVLNVMADNRKSCCDFNSKRL